jgi:predicted NBD/HSP70 family sugar kinase
MVSQLEKATHQHIKDHNSRMLLRAIYDAGAISRANLARLTRLTRTAVSEVVAGLIGAGFVEEVGHGPIGIGRTPTLLSVVEDGRAIVTVNITSAEIQGALVNLRGVVRREARLPLAREDNSSIQALLFPLIDSLVQAAASPLLGIGISSPGLIDTTNGVVRRAVNFNWQNLPLRTLVQQRYSLPVYIANDSHMAVMAEYMFGERQYGPNLVAINVGDGIGAGIVRDGKPLSSDTFGAGEIGHVVVERDGSRCSCGNAGCLEAVANIPAIVRRAQQLAANEPGSTVQQLLATQKDPFEAVLQAFAADDPAVCQTINEIGRSLSIAVANLVAILGIRQVVITGRIAPFGEALRESVRQGLHSHLLPELAQTAEISVVAQRPDAVLLGAAALLLANELGLTRLMQHPSPEETDVNIADQR